MVVVELRAAFVGGAERELGLLLRVEVQAEQLLVAADPGVVDQIGAVARIRWPVIEEVVVGEIDDFLRLEAHGVDVAQGAAHGRESDGQSVGREMRRFRIVDRLHRDPVIDLQGQDVLDDQGPFLLGADEIRDTIAARRPRQPRHRVGALTAHRDVGEPVVHVEAVGQVADDRPVLARDQNDVDFAVLAVDGDDGDEIARGGRRDGEGLRVARLLRIGRQIASVVGRPLAIAERLEAILQVAFEGLVEFVR